MPVFKDFTTNHSNAHERLQAEVEAALKKGKGKK